MTPASEAFEILADVYGDVALIRSNPRFAITSSGEVYRLTGACRPDYYPRKMNTVLMGAKTRRVPAVKLDGRSKTIASLMREHFPDQPQTKDA